MTNTKKYLLAAVVGTTLTLTCAAPALADHGPDQGYGYGDRHRYDDDGGKDCTHDDPGAVAEGSVSDSPGVGSGNLIQIPIHIPINICGNSIG
ncbi:chaplin [Streptomyces noboritoensis]|uniref:Chaplin n=1 Tax=Streptomyces noboritoensis TaxID=67337 RepID=A0ABV6TEK2_9ACTN